MNENEVKEQTENQMSDLEIAEMASKEIANRDKKIKELERQIAKDKLLYQPKEEEVEIVRSREDCLKSIFDPKTCNYDYAVAVCDFVDIEIKAGRPNPLGKDGDAVYEFLDNCIADCNGDKAKFVSIYQSKIGKDEFPAMRAKRR